VTMPLPRVATSYVPGRLICDVNVLVLAGLGLLRQGGDLAKLVTPTGTPELDILVELNAAAPDDPHWQLCSSPDLLRLTEAVLVQKYSVAPDVAGSLVTAIRDLIDDTDGAYARPTTRVTGVSGDPEDDWNVLSLAATLDARVIITKDRGLLGGDRTGWAAWPVPGVPVAVEALPPLVFAALLQAARKGDLPGS
jgi:hypothetical protein